MLTLGELNKLIEDSGKTIAEFSLSLDRSEKFIYVILNQYRGRSVIGQRVSALIYSHYPKEVKAIVGKDRAEALSLASFNRGGSEAGRKVGRKTDYKAKVKKMKAKMKELRPGLLAKLTPRDLTFLAERC